MTKHLAYITDWYETERQCPVCGSYIEEACEMIYPNEIGLAHIGGILERCPRCLVIIEIT